MKRSPKTEAAAGGREVCAAEIGSSVRASEWLFAQLQTRVGQGRGEISLDSRKITLNQLCRRE
eukprot:2175827-Pyramimonas_sp.AAC.1